MRIVLPNAALLALLVLSSACQSTGRSSFLLFGGSDQPQDRLVESVADAREVTTDAHAEFQAAFELYQRLTSPQAVGLVDLSEDFADAVESCQESSEDLAQSLDEVRTESTHLIEGWNAELAGFANDAMRKKSAAMMQDTEDRSGRITASLERLQERMQPVLLKLQDYGLFFHHNLNARALATLEDTYKDFDAEFRALTSEFDKAEREFETFLASFADAPESASK
jgi:hypothetical protein